MNSKIIEKKFYTTLTNETQYKAMRAFAQLQLSDQQRFAQGELYFAVGDYETAIFKWEQVSDNVLKNWGRKNIGDAYYQLNVFAKAEQAYLTINNNNKEIELEKLLGLANIYSKLNQSEKTYVIYKQLVEVDVNYKTIYSDALEFFEKQQKYNDAISIIVKKHVSITDEIISTVNAYFKQEANEIIEINSKVNTFIYRLIHQNSEHTTDVFQSISSYVISKGTVKEAIIQIVEAVNQQPTTYGNYLVEHAFKQIIQLLDCLYSQAENYTEVEHVLNRAIPVFLKHCQDEQKKIILNSYIGIKSNNSLTKPVYQMDDLKNLYDVLHSLAVKHSIKVESYIDNMAQHFCDHRLAIMIIGGFNSGKSTFINSILESDVLKADIIPTTSAITIVKNSATKNLTEWQDGVVTATSFEDLERVTTINHEKTSALSTSLILLTVPNSVLETVQLNIIDTPGFFDEKENTESNPTFDYLPLADEVLMSLTIDKPFSRNEKELVEKLLELEPEMNVSFVLNQVDRADEEELEEITEDLERKIQKAFTKTHPLYCYSSYEVDEYRGEMMTFLKSPREIKVNERVRKLIPYIQQYVKNAQQNLNQQVEETLTKLKLKTDELNQINDYAKDLKEQLANNQKLLIENFNNRVMDTTMQEIRHSILRIIRQQEGEIDYHLRLEPLIAQLNANINFHMGNYLAQQAQNFLTQQLGQWLKTNLVQFEQNFLNIKNLTLPHLNEALIQDLNKVVFPNKDVVKISEPLFVDISKMVWNEYIFINLNDFSNKWLNGIGKLLGSQNSQDYMKIDKAKEYIISNNFDHQINNVLKRYEHMYTIFIEELATVINKSSMELYEVVEKKLAIVSGEVNDKAKALKQLKLTLPEKNAHWELFERRAMQLSLLYVKE